MRSNSVDPRAGGEGDGLSPLQAALLIVLVCLSGEAVTGRPVSRFAADGCGRVVGVAWAYSSRARDPSKDRRPDGVRYTGPDGFPPDRAPGVFGEVRPPGSRSG